MTPHNRTIDKCNIFNRQVNPGVASNTLREGWLHLLDRYRWTWFTTLTWRDLPKTYTAINQTKKWLKAIEKDERIDIGYFMCLEYTKLQNRPHTHLIMGNLEGIRRSKWWSTWYTQHGAARILPYDQGKGAGYYLTKYVVKDVYQRASYEIKGLSGLDQLILTGVNS